MYMHLPLGRIILRKGFPPCESLSFSCWCSARDFWLPSEKIQRSESARTRLNLALHAQSSNTSKGSTAPRLPRIHNLLFLLMGAYANANQQVEGAEFLAARLNEFGPRLSDPQKALYLSAIGLLRGQHASSVSLLHRMGYVKDTIAMLDQAKRLSGGQIFVVDWISGVVRAQLPGFFHQRQAGSCARTTPE